jgi:hypothetical protein
MAMNQAAPTIKSAEVDFDRIMGRLGDLRALSIQLREKAWAIKTPAGDRGKPEQIEPPDASGKIMLSLEGTMDLLADARDSLQAFI